MVSKISDLISTRINEVYRTAYYWLFTLLVLTASSHPQAGDTLEASVDRNKLYKNESLNLKLTGNAKVDFSFGGLMSFGRNQVEAPVIEGLENDFEILDRQQNYSMRSINGDTTTEVTWNYTLSPKRSGTLTIPTASFQDAQSQAIKIEVLEGKAPVNADNPPPLFIEVEVDQNDIYVQEQVLYTVRLFSLGRLSSGSLSEPSTSNAIIEQFGEEKKYYRMAYNQRYEVIERNYLLFPQKSGSLEIPGITFNGTMIDSYKRRRLRVSEESDPVSLKVNPPNNSLSSDQWLPAKSLHLSENWQHDAAEYQVGDALTREITISALGLLGSALPPIPETENPAIKSYPDKPVVESNLHEAGSHSFRKQATTYIAVKEGTITLPEIKIPWWDTINDVARVATLPEKTIKISAAPNLRPQQSEQTETSVALPNKESETIASSKIPASQAKSNDTGINQAMVSIIVLLIIGWISTTWYLLQRLKSNSIALAKLTMHQTGNPSQSTLDFDTVVKAIKTHSPDIPKLILSWIGAQYKQSSSKALTLEDLFVFDEALANQVAQFEQQLYGKNSQSEYDSERLITLLKPYAKKRAKQSSANSSSLKPFYPQ